MEQFIFSQGQSSSFVADLIAFLRSTFDAFTNLDVSKYTNTNQDILINYIDNLDKQCIYFIA